jgi:hypothetical protein
VAAESFGYADNMTPTPQIVELRAELSGQDLAGRITQVLDQARVAGMGEPQSFQTPLGAPAKSIERLDLSKILDYQVDFALADGTQLAISTGPKASVTLIQVSRADDALTEEDVRNAQSRQAALLRGLFMTGEVKSGHIERVESGLDALPDVPLARKKPGVIATEREVAAAYFDTAPFWSAWSDSVVTGERRLLLRHLDAASTPAWFRACFEKQWAMARAARPGDTFYGKKIAPPGCEDLLMKGESRLRQVGYHDGYVELAAYVPDGTHIPPWEILAWSEVLLRGRLDDGSPVSKVRVVFRNEKMARTEASPLLDIEAEVVFLGPDGQYHPVA